MRLAVVVILGIDAVLSLATFLHSFITHGLSAHFDISHAMELANRPFYTAYDKGTFDLETWACETKDLPNYDSYPEGKVHTLCAVEAGARWMSFFVFLLACASCALVFVDHRGARYLMVTWKNRRASWHDDYY